MKTTEILTKIKTLLGVESEVVRLAQMKLEDGLTIVESESFAAGDEIVIVTEDGKVAMPVGEYTLEDERVLIVREEGVIAEVKEAKKEEEIEEVVEPDVDEEVETSTPKKVIESITKESFFSEIEALKTENESLKKEMEELKLKAVENTNKKEETKEVELTELEETKPIVHNPENKERVNLGRKISPNKQRTIMDSVFEKIANKNN